MTGIHGDAERVLADRIVQALEYAEAGVYDGAHHKNWVIDQMVRALTGCPIVEKSATAADGQVYTYDAQGESEEYRKFLSENAGWDEGIAP